MIEFESLPDELLIDILLRLSTLDIYDNARLVCRRWRHLIHTDAFVYAHLPRTTSGLLLTRSSELHRARTSPILVTATTQGRFEISKLSCRINFPIIYSCNGLALGLREAPKGREVAITPFIFNPATKCAFDLPRFKVGADQLFRGLRIAYAAASMAYKVVGSYQKLGGVEQCGILTVGVDNTWRNIVAVEGLSPGARWLLMYVRNPLIIGCFMHWVSETRVLSLNVETENFTMTPTPALMFPQGRNTVYYPLSTGECLSLLISCGDWSWEVWEMKPETWEWRKVIPKIDLEAHKCKIQQIDPQKVDVFVHPIGWLRYPEMLAFSFKYTYCIVYNLDTKEIDSIKLSTSDYYDCVVQHRNSLVWSEKWLR